MSFTKLHTADRASGALDSQLLSSQTTGTFTFSTLANLGTQSWQATAGDNILITIEDEQILLSALTVSMGTATATIATGGRGYNGTTAATHASTTVLYCHWTKAHIDNIQTHLAKLDDLGLINYTAYTPTITNASVHSVAGADVTGIFTAGRVYLFQVSGTWYRATVRSSSFSTDTTINIDGDTLIASGTITALGFEYSPSVKKPVDLQLIKNVTAAPANNPPSGYSWLFVKGGILTQINSAGVDFPITRIEASASSSAGVLTLDWSLASIYDVTLTENITGITHQNAVDGQECILRIKQHASAAKTVVIGTGGKTRFSNTIAGYTATTTVSAYDVLTFIYHATDDKYDFTEVTKGFQASPTQTLVNTPTYFEFGIDAPASYVYGQLNFVIDPSGDNAYFTKKTNAQTIVITRYSRDSGTGMYYKTTDTATYSSWYSTDRQGGIYAGATYVWIVGITPPGGSELINVQRYNKDLTGVTAMTVPGSAYSATIQKVCGDDSQFWVKRAGSATVDKYTISGTTVTASTGFSSSDSAWTSCMFNGTDIVYTTDTGSFKRVNTSGTLQGTKSPTMSSAVSNGIIFGMGYRDATSVYIAWSSLIDTGVYRGYTQALTYP